jgi:hypothetical protein
MVFLGVEHKSVRVVLAEGLCELGGITSAEGLRDGGGWTCPFSHYALAFALQVRKSTENLSQGSRAARGQLVAQTWLSFEGLHRLSCWTSDHKGFTSDFSQPTVGTGAFGVAAIRRSPHQLTTSQNSRSMF